MDLQHKETKAPDTRAHEQPWRNFGLVDRKVKRINGSIGDAVLSGHGFPGYEQNHKYPVAGYDVPCQHPSAWSLIGTRREDDDCFSEESVDRGVEAILMDFDPNLVRVSRRSVKSAIPRYGPCGDVGILNTVW
jgi:hypothetical protein